MLSKGGKLPRILGIDPGIRRTGYGVVDAEGSRFELVEGGIVRPPVDAHLSERLLCIGEEISELIERRRPDCCALENVYYHKNPKSMLTLGQAQAAAILAAAQHALPVSLYSPSEVKQALTGGGRAGKQQVRYMVERILGQKISEGKALDDLSDALAVAICHAGRQSGAAALGAQR